MNARHLDRFGWLVDDFADGVPGVAHAVVVSTDGLLLTASSRLPDERAEQFATVVAGLAGLTGGAARSLAAGRALRTVVEMDRGTLLTMTVGDGSCLAVLAAPDSPIGQVAYEMTLLVDRVGRVLTPERRDVQRLRGHLPAGQSA